MDNIQFWLYVIVAVIYLISRARKKSNQQREVSQEEYDTPENQNRKERPRQLTFEELLKEITEGKSTENAPKPVSSRPVSEYIDYDDDIKAEEEDLEDVNIDYRERDPIYAQYEGAKTIAFNRPSLEDANQIQDIDYNRFKEFEAQEEVLSEYTKQLRDPNGFKKAIIMSEILNRKHF